MLDPWSQLALREVPLGKGAGSGNDPHTSIAPHRLSAGKEGYSCPLQSREERGGFGCLGCRGEDRLLVGFQNGEPGREIWA